MLRLWWRAGGPKLDEHEPGPEQTRQLLEPLAERGKINPPKDITRAGVPDPHLTGPVRETLRLWEVNEMKPYSAFSLTETASEGEPGDGKRTQEVPEGFTAGCVIRTRQPGDRISPFGSNGTRKLQDYLTDRRIAEPFRDQIPLLCRNREVLLVCGVGAGNIPRWSRTMFRYG